MNIFLESGPPLLLECGFEIFSYPQLVQFSVEVYISHGPDLHQVSRLLAGFKSEVDYSIGGSFELPIGPFAVNAFHNAED